MKRIGWIIGAVAALLVMAVLAKAGRHKLRKVLQLRPAFAAQAQNQLAPRDAEILKPPRLDSWQIIGPGGGGTFYYPAVSPHDPNLVFTTSDMTDCFVSENGGRTWRQFNLRMTCQIVFDPKLPNRVYALTREPGVFRSDDRGHTWSLVYPDPSATQPPWYMDDESEVVLQAPPGWPPAAGCLAVDPDDSNSLYLFVYPELRMSKDAGKHWKTLATDVLAKAIVIDPTSPPDRRVVYTFNGNTTGTWDGSKYTQRKVASQTEWHGVAWGTPTGGGKRVVYTATDYVLNGHELKSGGLFATQDGGVTWRSMNEGFLKLVEAGTYPEFTTIGTSSNHAEVIYVSFERVKLPNDPKSYYGVAKSSDGGATWSIVTKEFDLAAANMHDHWITPRFGPDWGDEPLGIGVDPNNPDLVYTTDLGRVMRTTDGGKNWYSVYSQSTGKGYTTTGLDVTTCYGIHFDPFDKKRMFITYTDIGLFRSEDGGESWVSSTANGTIPRRWINTTYWVEFDPAVKGKMWAVMSQNHDIPRHRTFHNAGTALQFGGGVLISVDGGVTWKQSTTGMPSMAATHILLDPKSPPNARVLYVTGFGRGVYKSSDGGQTWVAKNVGLPETEPLTWRMTRDSLGTLYLVMIRRSEDGLYGNAGDGAVFRSGDGAETWERLQLPPGVNGPVGITVDPQDPLRLYVAAWGRYKLYAAGVPLQQGGVFRSLDGGHHWENTLDASQRIYDVSVDPRDPNLVYAVGFEASAYRSIDRGKTWSRIRGYNFKDGHRIIPDPADISKIYITTFGSSVWHGPAEGDPKAVEDIVAPPALTFNLQVSKSRR